MRSYLTSLPSRFYTGAFRGYLPFLSLRLADSACPWPALPVSERLGLMHRAYRRIAFVFSLLLPQARNGRSKVSRGDRARQLIASKCKILFLSTNPLATTRLRLDEESREIDRKIRASEHRDALEVITKWAVRPDDLLQYLNQYSESSFAAVSGYAFLNS